ncbi:tRNA U34 carboxymethyltransferase [Sinobacterium norvegicum]|uniref:tRNA U34 carboxymethyltransferase n=1 Tax=Sinobacterium norvegicum TaxID=1641715 RepID=A0ABM9AE66_9GAMM|nr:tRNA 5-methoxyuridine(34)/uridine 5-oxyacetic acid(34) synthase CmoB [Sinobacterium norvegicum]CAH0991499.1 tRNA U34 carboxymethyltransferase [Sinobacterium norvegicum]
MINFDEFFRQLADSDHPLHPFAEQINTTINSIYTPYSHGDEISWQQAIEQLPELSTESTDLNSSAVTARGAVSENQQQQLHKALMGLHPWRKGPFDLFDVYIDTEWRSDWKWQRVAAHLGSLRYKNILDVGCGSGYHCLRMAGAGANTVVGIDPSLKFLYQFKAINYYTQANNVHLLPLKSEQLPYRMQCFDTVFSMGVLYHRKSPFEHLEELKYTLKPGGQLVLETLVVDGGLHTVLVPDDRYAQMRNVWFLPSCDELLRWVERAGFINAKVVDVDTTKLEEQRSTDWMNYQSLQDFLDPNDHAKTVEGYQAPTRATIIATRK